MGADRFIRVGAACGAMRGHRASGWASPRDRYALPSAGFFFPVAALPSSSDAQASHFEGCLATVKNNLGQMAPIYLEPLLTGY